MPFYKMTDRRKREDGYWEKRERIEKEHTLVVPKCIDKEKEEAENPQLF